MAIQFYNDQILFVGGEIAMHSDCCCIVCPSTDDDIDAYFYDIENCNSITDCGVCCITEGYCATLINEETYRLSYSVPHSEWRYEDGTFLIQFTCDLENERYVVQVSETSCTKGLIYYFSSGWAALENLPATLNNSLTDCNNLFPNCHKNGSVDLSIVA